ncbi:MAG: hypothetical protein J5849_06080 [Clostridia bacterium]|nr:hypothetical protein [Clostridia bacterium]
MLHLSKGLVPFWDDHLIDRRFTDARLEAVRPERAEIVMTCDQPWEGDSTDFFTILKDDGFFRMYYETWSLFDPAYHEGINVCYAESRDGIHWEKPDLGLCEFRGSTHNNIIMREIPDNITVMKDENPACPPERRYKAIMANKDVSGCVSTFPDTEGNSLICLTSADGIRFERYSVVSRGYAYDSQNTVHWNPHAGKYYCYFREFHEKPETPGSRFRETSVRGILVSESEDFLHWSEPVPLDFGGSEDVPLYTNCVSAYPYDTRYYIGFPTRYVERKEWNANYDRLCGAELRRKRMEMSPRLGLAVTDCVFMSSRDNVRWYRFDEACLTPGPETGLNWVYGDCYPAAGGVIETPARFPGEPAELSLYVDNHHWMPKSVELVRYVYRRDGFASVRADYKGRTLRTSPFVFEGEELALNFRTSARGGIVLRILDEKNLPVAGYETPELFGDSVDRTVDFPEKLGALRGRTVKFNFSMRDAELFAMRFR